MSVSENSNGKMDITISPKECTCKVIEGSAELPTSSKEWTRAKRCTLTLEEDSLSYLDSSIHYQDIEQATIHIYPSALFFEYGVFSVMTAERNVHFGIKYSDFWKEELPFEVERIKQETPYILFRKTLIILILIYIFWEVVKN